MSAGTGAGAAPPAADPFPAPPMPGRARRLRALALLTASEFRLFLRDPGAAFFALLFPLVLLFANASAGDAQAGRALPMLTATVVAMIGLLMVPAFIAEYRHTGVLRRLMATPASPLALLTAVTAAHLAIALAAMALLLATGAAVFGTGGPDAPVAFAAAWLLGALSLAAVGFVVAALAPTARSATGIGFLLFFPMLYVSGTMVPRENLPDAAAAAGAWTPLGPVVSALEDAWDGEVAPVRFAAMAAVLVAAGALSARTFRY